VGSTRAMEALSCSYAERRFRFGSIVPSEPSRFIADIPEELYQFQNCAAYFAGAAVGSTFINNSDRRGAINGNNGRAAGPSSINNRRASINNAPRRESPSLFDQTADATPSSRSSAPKYDMFSQESEPQYRMGQSVAHKTFGQGKIVSISGLGPDTKLTVLFSDGIRRKLLAKFAKFE